MVAELVRSELGVAEAKVEVVDGGARGMRVTVTLTEATQPSVYAVEAALSTYLFEAKVNVSAA
jgi:fatty-acyl-CoA synthase